MENRLYLFLLTNTNIHPFTPDSAKSKTDKFSNITNWVKVKDKQHQSKVQLNSFPMNGHTLGFCLYNQKFQDFVYYLSLGVKRDILSGFCCAFSHADGVLLYSNDDVLHDVTTYTGFQSQKTSFPSISFKDMNSYIAGSLAGVLQPLESKPQKLVTRQTDKDTSVAKLHGESKSIRLSRKSGKMGSHSKNLDTISKIVSFDESFDKFSLMKNRSSVSAKSITSAASFTSHGNLPFSIGDLESLDEMSRQPRSSTSALLRYRGMVNCSYTNKKTHNSNSFQSSRLAAGVSAGNEPWEMLRSLCSEPSTKFASIHHIVKSKVSWESLTQFLLHSIRRYDKKGKQFSTIAALLIARGDDSRPSFAENATKIEERLRTSLKCVEWNPFPVDFWLSKYNIAVLSHIKK